MNETLVNTGLSVAELSSEKTALQREIVAVLNKFTERTGIDVVGVNVRITEYIGGFRVDNAHVSLKIGNLRIG